MNLCKTHNSYVTDHEKVSFEETLHQTGVLLTHFRILLPCYAAPQLQFFPFYSTLAHRCSLRAGNAMQQF